MLFRSRSRSFRSRVRRTAWLKSSCVIARDTLNWISCDSCAMPQEDFNQAVRRTRERKDRERTDQIKRKGGDQVYPAVQPSVATP